MPGLRPVQALEGRHVHQELCPGEFRIVSEILGQVPKLCPVFLRGHIVAVQGDAAPRRPQDAAQQPHQRRLPRPVGPQQPVDAGDKL